MHTPICGTLGIEYPIVGFSPNVKVVAAISQAGGLGVLGAASMLPERLEKNLSWLDEQLGDLPYGVDVIIPATSVDDGNADPEAAVRALRSQIPPGHQKFVEDLLERFDVPPLAAGNETELARVLFSDLTARAQLEVAFAHNPRLIVNALGTFPRDLIDRAEGSGILTAALAGKVAHAKAHRDAGIDIIISTGYEAAGHTGDISGMVLHAEISQAVAPMPVLASGAMATGRQIAAAVALGAQGGWCGSVWLTTEENDVPELDLFRGFIDARERYLAAEATDSVRTRSVTGKPARLLRTKWSEAWEGKDSPGYLPMPLQGLLVDEALERVAHANRDDLAFMPAGQVIGMINTIRPVAKVIADMVEEYDATISLLGDTIN